MEIPVCSMPTRWCEPRGVCLLLVLLFADGFALAADRVTGSFEIGDVRRTVELPAGFVLELVNQNLRGPRLLTFAPDGDLFIGSRRGYVYRLPPPYERAYKFAQLKGYPHSVAFRGERLFIARTDGLYVAPWRSGDTTLDPARLSKVAALPASGGHDSRTVAVGPDQRVYLSIGISGNCADEYLSEDYPFEARRGGILVLDEARVPVMLRPFASGLRNPVGFAWHPQTAILYASNNGPDHLGFDLPPEYFSELHPGSFHGMPWYQFDGESIRRDPCAESSAPLPATRVTKPVAIFPARNAPMGVAFITGNSALGQFAGDAVVALRGSWGTAPRGSYTGDPATRRPPALARVHFDNGRPSGEVTRLLTGFQQADGSRWARPVGVAVGPDGALYFTSDEGTQGLFRLRPE